MTGLDRADESSVRAFEAADMIRLIREIMEGLITPLREQLERERNRADCVERRVDELQTALAEERRRVFAILTESRTPWWRRWFSEGWIWVGFTSF